MKNFRNEEVIANQTVKEVEMNSTKNNRKKRVIWSRQKFRKVSAPANDSYKNSDVRDAINNNLLLTLSKDERKTISKDPANEDRRELQNLIFSYYTDEKAINNELLGRLKKKGESFMVTQSENTMLSKNEMRVRNTFYGKSNIARNSDSFDAVAVIDAFNKALASYDSTVGKTFTDYFEYVYNLNYNNFMYEDMAIIDGVSAASRKPANNSKFKNIMRELGLDPMYGYDKRDVTLSAFIDAALDCGYTESDARTTYFREILNMRYTNDSEEIYDTWLDSIAADSILTEDTNLMNVETIDYVKSFFGELLYRNLSNNFKMFTTNKIAEMIIADPDSSREILEDLYYDLTDAGIINLDLIYDRYEYDDCSDELDTLISISRYTDKPLKNSELAGYADVAPSNITYYKKNFDEIVEEIKEVITFEG